MSNSGAIIKSCFRCIKAFWAGSFHVNFQEPFLNEGSRYIIEISDDFSINVGKSKKSMMFFLSY